MREKHTLLDDGTVKVESWSGDNYISGVPDIYSEKTMTIENYVHSNECDWNQHHRYGETHDWELNAEGQRRIRKEERARVKAEKAALTLAAETTASVAALTV